MDAQYTAVRNVTPVRGRTLATLHLPNSSLQVIDDDGHCPHMSEPTASSAAIDTFLARTLA